MLQDIPTLNGQDSSQLKDWLTDIETASELTGQNRTKIAQAKSKGLVRILISEVLTAQKTWEEIKDSLQLKISNADIHTSISCFMDIQQTDKESLATYIHRFKQEANRCKFKNDTATIRIFLKGLKNAHTIATNVYEKGLQTLGDTLKEVEKLQAVQQITSTLIPTSSVNTMASDNDKCFQCQETGHMARYCPHIRCFNCDNYGHVAVDCPDKIPPLGTPACHRGNTTSRHDRSSSRHHSHTGIPTMIIKIGTGSVVPNPTHTTLDTGVTATMTPTGVAPDHFIDLHIIAFHATEAQVHTTIAMTHHTADPHPIGIFPEITADPDHTNPTSSFTNQHKDLLQAQKQQIGKIRTEVTNRLQLTIIPQNTIVQMIRIVTLRMI